MYSGTGCDDAMVGMVLVLRIDACGFLCNYAELGHRFYYMYGLSRHTRRTHWHVRLALEEDRFRDRGTERMAAAYLTQYIL